MAPSGRVVKEAFLEEVCLSSDISDKRSHVDLGARPDLKHPDTQRSSGRRCRDF